MKRGKANMSISLFPRSQKACGLLPVPAGYAAESGFSFAVRTIWLLQVWAEQTMALNDIGMKWRNTSQIRA